MGSSRFSGARAACRLESGTPSRPSSHTINRFMAFPVTTTTTTTSRLSKGQLTRSEHTRARHTENDNNNPIHSNPPFRCPPGLQRREDFFQHVGCSARVRRRGVVRRSSPTAIPPPTGRAGGGGRARRLWQRRSRPRRVRGDSPRPEELQELVGDLGHRVGGQPSAHATLGLCRAERGVEWHAGHGTKQEGKGGRPADRDTDAGRHTKRGRVMGGGGVDGVRNSLTLQGRSAAEVMTAVGRGKRFGNRSTPIRISKSPSHTLKERLDWPFSL